MFEHTLTAAGMRPNTNLEFHSMEAIKQCVIAGLGVTLVPEVAVRRECEAGELVPLAWAGPSFSVWTQMAWSRSVYMDPALKCFIEMSETSAQVVSRVNRVPKLGISVPIPPRRILA